MLNFKLKLIITFIKFQYESDKQKARNQTNEANSRCGDGERLITDSKYEK